MKTIIFFHTFEGSSVEATLPLLSRLVLQGSTVYFFSHPRYRPVVESTGAIFLSYGYESFDFQQFLPSSSSSSSVNDALGRYPKSNLTAETGANQNQDNSHHSRSGVRQRSGESEEGDAPTEDTMPIQSYLPAAVYLVPYLLDVVSSILPAPELVLYTPTSCVWGKIVARTLALGAVSIVPMLPSSPLQLLAPPPLSSSWPSAGPPCTSDPGPPGLPEAPYTTAVNSAARMLQKKYPLGRLAFNFSQALVRVDAPLADLSVVLSWCQPPPRSSGESANRRTPADQEHLVASDEKKQRRSEGKDEGHALASIHPQRQRQSQSAPRDTPGAPSPTLSVSVQEWLRATHLALEVESDSHGKGAGYLDTVEVAARASTAVEMIRSYSRKFMNTKEAYLQQGEQGMITDSIMDIACLRLYFSLHSCVRYYFNSLQLLEQYISLNAAAFRNGSEIDHAANKGIRSRSDSTGNGTTVDSLYDRMDETAHFPHSDDLFQSHHIVDIEPLHSSPSSCVSSSSSSSSSSSFLSSSLSSSSSSKPRARKLYNFAVAIADSSLARDIGNEFTGHCYSIVDSDAQDYKQRTPIVSAENEIGEDVDVYYVVRGTMSCDDDSIAHAVARETLASSVLSSSSSFSSSSSSFPPSPDRDTTAASDASIDADHPVSSSTAHTASARVDQSVLRVCQRLNRKRNGFLMQVKQKRKQRKQRKEEEEDCKGEIARFIAEADANASADGRELNPHTQKHNHDTTDANGADSNATDHSIFLIILTIPNTLHIHASRIGANDGSSNNIDITDNKGEGKDGHDEHDGSDGSGSGNGPVKRADALATYPFVPVCFHGSLPEDDENDESDPDHNSADDDDDKDDAYSSRFELVELADREMFLIDDSDNDLKGEEKGKLLGEHTVEGNSSLSTMRGDGGDGEHDTNNGNGHDRRDPLRKQGVMRKLEENYNFF